LFFFFNDPATTEIYTLSLHDALPIWKVGSAGGSAIRLTSHPGEESQPAISSDGKTIAFVAQYEGPSEVYTMPIAGGLPTRRTFDGSGDGVVGWTPDG